MSYLAPVDRLPACPSVICLKRLQCAEDRVLYLESNAIRPLALFSCFFVISTSDPQILVQGSFHLQVYPFQYQSPPGRSDQFNPYIQRIYGSGYYHHLHPDQ